MKKQIKNTNLIILDYRGKLQDYQAMTSDDNAAA